MNIKKILMIVLFFLIVLCLIYITTIMPDDIEVISGSIVNYYTKGG